MTHTPTEEQQAAISPTFTFDELGVIYASVFVAYIRNMELKDSDKMQSIMTKLESFRGMGATRQ